MKMEKRRSPRFVLPAVLIMLMLVLPGCPSLSVDLLAGHWGAACYNNALFGQ